MKSSSFMHLKSFFSPLKRLQSLYCYLLTSQDRHYLHFQWSSMREQQSPLVAIFTTPVKTPPDNMRSKLCNRQKEIPKKIHWCAKVIIQETIFYQHNIYIWYIYSVHAEILPNNLLIIPFSLSESSRHTVQVMPVLTQTSEYSVWSDSKCHFISSQFYLLIIAIKRNWNLGTRKVPFTVVNGCFQQRERRGKQNSPVVSAVMHLLSLPHYLWPQASRVCGSVMNAFQCGIETFPCSLSCSLFTHQTSNSWAVSGDGPAEGDYGQAEEGAEGGVEGLDLCRRPGLSQSPVRGAVRFIAHGYFTP